MRNHNEYQSHVKDIFIDYSAINILTDDDSGDQDGGGMIDNLTGRQLKVPVEWRLENNERIGGFSVIETPNVTILINQIYSTSSSTR